MNMLSAIRLVRNAATGDRMDCCVFVAKVLAHMAEDTETFAPGTDWWERANVWEANSPYSSVSAAVEVVEQVTGQPHGQSRFYGNSATLCAESLDPNSMYVVQGWRLDGTGHTFFLQTHDATGWGCVVVESSAPLGLRAGGKRWEGTLDVEPEFTLNRLSRYTSGIGVTKLWPVS